MPSYLIQRAACPTCRAIGFRACVLPGCQRSARAAGLDSYEAMDKVIAAGTMGDVDDVIVSELNTMGEGARAGRGPAAPEPTLTGPASAEQDGSQTDQAERGPTLYIAAPLAQAWRARAVAHYARRQGYRVVSTWHDTVSPDAVDPITWDERGLILGGCLAELDRADLVLALVDQGNPRSTLCEAGWALAQGKPVVWLGANVSIFDSHAMSTVVTAEHDVWEALERAQGLLKAEVSGG